MLVKLSVVEQRYHAVMEVISGGVPVVEVAERYGVSQNGARLAASLPLGRLGGTGRSITPPASPPRTAGCRPVRKMRPRFSAAD